MKKFNQFISESMTGDINDLIDDATDSVLPQFKKINLWDHTRGRSWTRRDGSRFTDFNSFDFALHKRFEDGDEWEGLQYKNSLDFYRKKDMLPKNFDMKMVPKNQQQTFDKIWKKIEAKGKKVKLTRSFRDSSLVDGIFYKRYIVLRKGDSIEYGSKSRLRNSSVWRVVE